MAVPYRGLTDSAVPISGVAPIPIDSALAIGAVLAIRVTVPIGMAVGAVDSSVRLPVAVGLMAAVSVAVLSAVPIGMMLQCAVAVGVSVAIAVSRRKAQRDSAE